MGVVFNEVLIRLEPIVGETDRRRHSGPRMSVQATHRITSARDSHTQDERDLSPLGVVRSPVQKVSRLGKGRAG